LFISDDKEKFLQLFNNSPLAQTIMADIVKWVYGETDINDPLTYIKNHKDADTAWRVGKSSEARIFYAQRNTDNFFQILGVGDTFKPEDGIASVDKILSPTIAGLIAAL
jgi:hypothetical protein